MASDATSSAAGQAAEDPGSGNSRLAILLSMAMFVLVVDTSIMNVSISAVVHDIGTTVSGIQGDAIGVPNSVVPSWGAQNPGPSPGSGQSGGRLGTPTLGSGIGAPGQPGAGGIGVPGGIGTQGGIGVQGGLGSPSPDTPPPPPPPTDPPPDPDSGQ